MSSKCEYAILAVLDLAIQNSELPVRISEIAQRQRIPQKFLEGILTEMRRAGILVSKRGAEGGYLLGRPAEQITVGQVVRTIESGRGRLVSGDHGPLGRLFTDLDASIASVLDRATFAELARRWREQQSAYVPDWQI